MSWVVVSCDVMLFFLINKWHGIVCTWLKKQGFWSFTLCSTCHIKFKLIVSGNSQIYYQNLITPKWRNKKKKISKWTFSMYGSIFYFVQVKSAQQWAEQQRNKRRNKTTMVGFLRNKKFSQITTKISQVNTDLKYLCTYSFSPLWTHYWYFHEYIAYQRIKSLLRAICGVS